MYLKKHVVEEKERAEKESSTRMWRTKLWEGDWDTFIKQTDENFTKSNPLVSRLEMLKNSIEFGFPTLALKIFKSKSLLEQPLEESPKTIRYLSVYQDMMDHQTSIQFLTSAFGTPYDVLTKNKIKDKGEHLFYLLNVGAETADINDFIETRILKGMKMADYQNAIMSEENLVIEPELSYEDYISLTFVCLWEDAATKQIQNLLSDLWFRKFGQNANNSKEKKIFKAFEELAENYETHCFEKPIPMLNISQITDHSKLDNIYNELRNAVDHFSFLAKKNKSELYMNDIQDYVYKQKVYENGEVNFLTKKDFFTEKISKKQNIVNNLNMSFHFLMDRVEAKTCPI